MEIVIISEDINTTKTPSYTTRALKYNLFDIYHINDTITCDFSFKLQGCTEDTDDILDISKIPTSYSAQMKSSYNINQIADQDGNVDENCTRAFINKIMLQESFSYLECMEDNIAFDYLLSEILYYVKYADDIHVVTDTLYSVTNEIINNLSVIVNENMYYQMDISSGVITDKKTKKQELYQFDSLPLYDNKSFLESYNLEMKKEGADISISLNVRLLTVDIIIEKITGNTEPVNLSTENIECGTLI